MPQSKQYLGDGIQLVLLNHPNEFPDRSVAQLEIEATTLGRLTINFTTWYMTEMPSVFPRNSLYSSRKAFYAKYFNTDTEQYIKDISAWDADFVDVAAANWLPWSDPAQPSVDRPIKTVSSGFQSIPETMVEQFLAANSK